MSYTLIDHLNEILKEDFEKIRQEFKGITEMKLVDSDEGWRIWFYSEDFEKLFVIKFIEFNINFKLNNFAENVIYEIENQTSIKEYLFFKKEITWEEKDTLIEYLVMEEHCLTDWNDEETLHIHELIEAIEDEDLRNWLVDKGEMK